MKGSGGVDGMPGERGDVGPAGPKGTFVVRVVTLIVWSLILINLAWSYELTDIYACKYEKAKYWKSKSIQHRAARRLPSLRNGEGHIPVRRSIY